MSWPEKIKQVKQNIRSKESLIVALSGGVDSSVVAALAHAALGEKSLAVTVDSPLLCSGELEDAQRVAGAVGIDHLIVRLNELEMLDFSRNPPERCYLCKRLRFAKLRELAEERGYQHIADGTTASDLGEHRPGMQAAGELGIYHPLAEARLSQQDTAEIAQFLKLPVAGKAHNSCLATRLPYGEELSPERLRRIDQAENLIREMLPPTQLRIRDHGDLARLELAPDTIAHILSQNIYPQIALKLKELGYRFVTLDLDGYRFGSFDR